MIWSLDNGLLQSRQHDLCGHIYIENIHLRPKTQNYTVKLYCKLNGCVLNDEENPPTKVLFTYKKKELRIC